MDKISYISCWIYILIGLFFLIQIHKNNINNYRKIGFHCFFIIYIFAILRYRIGYDYDTYWNIVTLPNRYREDFEYLPKLIFELVQLMGFPPLVFIVFSTISLFCYKKVIDRYSKNQAVSWYFYFSYPLMFIQDCSTIRQSASMGFFFLVFFYIESGKKFKSIICIILACLFHNSGISSIFLLSIPLLKKIGLKQNIILWISSFFAGKLLYKVLSTYLPNLPIVQRLLYYTDLEMDGFNVFHYVLYGINILNLMFTKKLTADNRNNILFINLVNAGLCFFNLFQFESQSATRMCNFFILFQLLIMPSYISILERLLKSRIVAKNLLFLIMMSLQLMMIITYIKAYNAQLLDRAVYVPYQTWLFKL